MATISYSMQLILYNEKEKILINDIELKSLKANQMLLKKKFNIYINEQRIRKKIRLYKWKKKSQGPVSIPITSVWYIRTKFPIPILFATISS